MLRLLLSLRTEIGCIAVAGAKLRINIIKLKGRMEYQEMFFFIGTWLWQFIFNWCVIGLEVMFGAFLKQKKIIFFYLNANALLRSVDQYTLIQVTSWNLLNSVEIRHSEPSLSNDINSVQPSKFVCHSVLRDRCLGNVFVKF